MDEKIKSRFVFKRLLPLEKCPIKADWLSAILIDDTTEDLEKEEERFKWKISL